MATEQIPLLFFKPCPGMDPLTAAQSLLSDSPTGVVSLDPKSILASLKRTRGFSKLKIALPSFSFDNPRAEAALEGIATPTHLHVRFYGNFDKVAEPLFKAFTAVGLACYSIWDKSILTTWPKAPEPKIDKGFAARMQRVLDRKAEELRQTIHDARAYQKALDAFLKSPEFIAAMAAEARGENPKAKTDLVNCYVRWAKGKPSAGELHALRKLDPRLAAVSVSELRAAATNEPRSLVERDLSPGQAADLTRRAEQLGLRVETTPAE